MTSYVDVGLETCWLADSRISDMFFWQKWKKSNKRLRNDCSNEGHNKKMKQKFCQKNQNSPGFWKYQQWRLENQWWRLKKLETLRSLIWLWYHVNKNCISYSYLESIQPMKYTHNNGKERIRRNPYKDYIHTYTHNYIYIHSCTHNCTTYTVVYYSYISSTAAYYNYDNIQ